MISFLLKNTCSIFSHFNKKLMYFILFSYAYKSNNYGISIAGIYSILFSERDSFLNFGRKLLANPSKFSSLLLSRFNQSKWDKCILGKFYKLLLAKFISLEFGKFSSLSPSTTSMKFYEKFMILNFLYCLTISSWKI